jgi:hypothetical protein
LARRHFDRRLRGRASRNCAEHARCNQPAWSTPGRVLSLAAVAIFLATSASAQPTSPGPRNEADAFAICTAWRLAAEGVRLAGEVGATATDRADRATVAVGECRSRQCPRDDLLVAEQEVREAQYALVRATELAAAMKQRQQELSARLQQFRGDHAIDGCENLPEN